MIRLSTMAFIQMALTLVVIPLLVAVGRKTRKVLWYFLTVLATVTGLAISEGFVTAGGGDKGTEDLAGIFGMIVAGAIMFQIGQEKGAPTKDCTHCGEKILHVAIKCRYCGTALVNA